MIEALLPDGAIAVEATPAHYDAPLAAEEQALVAGAIDRRRREFAAGRACARDALAKLEVAVGAILRDERGAPIWPPGVSGSLTHCRDYCAAVVARSEGLRSLGADAERVGRLHAKILPRIAGAKERDRLVALPEPESADWPTLVFSAKEAVFKAHAGLGLPGPAFAAIEIDWDLEARAFRARGPSTEFLGAFAVREDLVITLAWQT